ncbi:hypothetical protein CJ200_15205 [Citrobacter freundii]|uniref:hypothetical protein n=1 Tax=Citrobacter freundii TaxID=546 RepID=UPI000C805348|nr:hypothetical protein [Citrobacter freundii]PMD01339.1 hypothetical protein CJ200_15205 [Citrobacter freundii]WLV36674.1 hypothetical protein M2O47_11615 [Citrobacter freundii]HCJ7432690.1 hypothetical protein [Citrobacter freundii]
MNKIDLEALCVKIRDCLDEWSADGTLETLTGSATSKFPNGCCGFITECLSVILYKMTGVIPDQVRAVCNEDDTHYDKLAANSHLWLQMNGLNIDLTGDQFNDGDINIPPVLVSSTPHPLTSKMETSTQPAYLIGITKPSSGFDSNQLRLIKKLRDELNLY